MQLTRLALAVLFSLALGYAAHAAQSSWGWWGTNHNTIVPISVANPLPVHCI